MIAHDLSADHLTELVPPASLAEARSGREALAGLLARERGAAADFLVALADFDRRRGWEALGHASLFGFLTRELGLSKGGAFFRLTAAQLLQRFPVVLEPLRDGRLCMTSVVELARVLTPENQAEVLPRFFGCSSREAKVVAVALAPREDPPLREVVTRMPGDARGLEVVQSTEPGPSLPGGPAAPTVSGPILAPPPPLPRTEVEPLSADLRRLHLTVSARLLQKVAAARDGLSHVRPEATTEQVLEAALDLLLAHQAKAKALVKHPRPAAGPASGRHVPAAVERAVRLRDGDRCQFPLDAGGVCGSTWQVELDHMVPLALGGPTTVANLRCTCARHNRRAAALALGEAVMAQRRRKAKRRRGG